MPGLAMDFSNGNRITNESSGDNSSYKDSCSQQLSPRSPLSPHSPHSDESIDLAIDNAIDTSIEQLYNNVCEMESSDQSPSRPSFISYGEESRIDSELCHLIGHYDAPEMMKEVSTQEKKDFTNENSTKGIAVQSKSSPRSVASFERPPSSKKGERNPRKLQTISSMKKQKKQPALRGGKRNGAEDFLDVEEFDGPEVGPVLLKQTRHMISTGENPGKALQLALRALKSYEKHADGKTNLDLVMCLHVLAAINCKLGQYNEAIPILERSIEIPVIEDGPDHSLAKFAGCMQLGDIYAMLGQLENSILCYTAGMEIQRQVLGETDPRVGETCRYVAEAHVQALQFDEAEKLCQMALDIHKENGSLNSLEEAADRRLMGLICDSKGDYESALEHYAIASMAMSSNGQKTEVAAIDCSIGDAYLALARYDEAICAYNKALAAFKPSKGENHPAVASLYARLADLYHKIGKFKQAKSYCENALRIYTKPNPGTPLEEVANGLIDISAIYQSMDDLDRALKLIKKALKIYGNAPGQQATIAGIEAQMGVMYYMMGNYSDSYTTLKSSISKFRASAEKKSLLFGIALNQMGLTCVQRYAINEAAELFEEAKDILEQEYGPYHPDTLGVCSNLAGTYDAMGRLDDAIEILEYVVVIREEKLGTANPDVDDEKRRLAELLKEAGRERNRKSRRLEMLLAHNSRIIRDDGIT